MKDIFNSSLEKDKHKITKSRIYEKYLHSWKNFIFPQKESQLVVNKYNEMVKKKVDFSKDFEYLYLKSVYEHALLKVDYQRVNFQISSREFRIHFFNKNHFSLLDYESQPNGY